MAESQSAEYAKFELAQNDVVLAMDRPWVTAGLKVASIEENDLPCLQVQRTARLRVGTELHWTYLFHLIRSSSFVQYISVGRQVLAFHTSVVSKYLHSIPQTTTPHPTSDRGKARCLVGGNEAIGGDLRA